MSTRSRALAMSRRGMLRTAGLVVAAAAGVPAVSGCALLPHHEATDPLLPLARSATSDAAKARTVATAYPGFTAAAAVAKARTEQANALLTEIRRAQISPAPTETPPRTASVPTKDQSAAKQTLRSDLAAAQRAAADLLATLPDYRAGLVGSVSAGCASLRELLS